MKSLLLTACLLGACPLSGQTLSKITILPPSDGSHLANVSATAQFATLCTYSNNSTDNCSSQTLTWGSSSPIGMSVSSTGLAQWGPSFGGHIVTLSRSGGVTTVTTDQTFFVPLFQKAIIEGATDPTFNGTYGINSSSSSASNTLSYTNGGADATTTGGKMFFTGGLDVYAYSGSVLGHLIVNIDSSVITSIAIRPETVSNEIVVGSTVIVSAEDSTSNNVDGAAIGDYCAWTSSNPSIAKVDSIGNVTGVAAGTATITCTLAGVTGTRSVTVTSPTVASNTWYVRPDGGTLKDANVPSGQCDGTLNVALAGSSGGHCALINPMYLFTDETSNTVYTGVVQAGDTAIITPGPTPYLMGSKSSTVQWVTQPNATFPAGTPSHPTRILGSNFVSCSSTSAMTKLENYFAFGTFNLEGIQNVDIECINLSNWSDCNQGLETSLAFDCPVTAWAPSGLKSQIPILVDTFSSNVLLKNDFIHGFTNGFDGTPGPGLIMDHVTSWLNWQAGLDFDSPFGYNGNRTEGFTGQNLDVSYSGCTEQQPSTLTSAARDGSGHLTVNFVANQVANYVVGTNLVLTGMTPSDLNGTFPVSSIAFNQQTVSITGGTCTEQFGGSNNFFCVFNTSTAPAFGIGAFVNITGASPSFLNGGYEVNSTTSSSFTVAASRLSRPGWSNNTIASGGTASTASTLVATASGSNETASSVGTASHVIPGHRCLDQFDSGFADGDGVGTGNNTIGPWKCDHCTFIANLQDGWDMLHSAMTESTYTNSYSASNQGAPAKFGNADKGTFFNNVNVANGGSLLAFDPNRSPDFNQYISTPYRGGDAFPVNSRMWSTMIVTNNTWIGGFNTMQDDGCSDAAGCTSLPAFENFVTQNNLWIGFQDINNPVFNSSPPGMYCGADCNGTGNTNPAWQWVNNIGFNVRNGPVGTNNQWSTNPLVVQLIPDIATFADEVNALNFDMHLTSGSPAIGAGVENAFVPTLDNAGNTRPNPPSIGAFELPGGVPSPLVFSGNFVLRGTVTLQ